MENQSKLWISVKSKMVIESCSIMQLEEILGASEVGTYVIEDATLVQKT